MKICSRQPRYIYLYLYVDIDIDIDKYMAVEAIGRDETPGSKMKTKSSGTNSKEYQH